MNSDRLTFVDLFAGAGGMSVGFKDAGFTSIFAVEHNKWAAQTYALNFGNHVKSADIEDIEIFPNASVVIGGPPCQGFSSLGQQDENDPRNQLWRHYMRALRSIKPFIFVIENVPEILKSCEFEKINQEANALGYEIKYRILNSADYGVPQKRKRAIIIGSRIGEPKFPVQTHCEIQDGQYALGLKPWVTVREAFEGLPLKPDGSNWHVERTPTPSTLERFKHIPLGGNRFDLPDNLKPECWKRKKTGSTDVFGRIKWDEPSLTIRTEFFKPEKGRYIHPDQHRAITHREAARLQTFPDSFVFAGSNIEVAKQIGNAVPCKLAYNIALSVKEMINKNLDGRL